jgi:hypothetical protein
MTIKFGAISDHFRSTEYVTSRLQRKSAIPPFCPKTHKSLYVPAEKSPLCPIFLGNFPLFNRMLATGPYILTKPHVGAEFDSFWEAQKQSALVTLSQDEGLM